MKTLTACMLTMAAAMAADVPPTSAALQEAKLRQLQTVRRVFVDKLTGGETAAQMRDILISSLASAELFIITENQERADATLRGASEDLVFTEVHQSSDNISAHANLGTPRTGNSSTGSRGGAYGGLSVGEGESDRSSDRRHEAIAAVRLVNKDGDVIWSTTQESLGAKFHGASADVAEKITARLKEDFEKARKLP
jgi:hypothetical protein